MGSSNKPQTIGYRYFMGIHMGLCRGPIDELREIRAGDRTAWKGSAVGQARWMITASSLFGGDEGEGGIYGTIDLMLGTETQPVNPRLKRMLGSALVPAFRGITTLFFDGLVSSMNPYPKAWAFRARRVISGWDDDITWYPEKSVVWLGNNTISAMNGAHIIYEAFTNRDWGRGRPAARIHDASFRAAADQLFAEGFGLCICWRRQDGIGALVKSVIDHIGAVLIDDLVTGQVSLNLIRDNYVVADLPIFDEETGLLGIDDDEAADGSMATNEVVVKFRNMMLDGADDQVRVQNNAAIQSVGAVLPETVDYPHIPTSGLAGRLAQRDLRAKSAAVRRFKVRLDRRGTGILPGSVFRVRSLKRGYDQLILRAGPCDYGTLQAGTVTISAVIDAFGLPDTAYVEVQEPTIKAPTAEPLAATVRRMFEIPYRDLARYLDPSQWAAVSNESGAVGMIARRPSAAAANYVLLTRVGSASFGGVDTGDWCPTAQIASALDYLTTTVRITYGTDISTVAPGQPALIGNEIVRVVNLDINTGNLVIARGCADTIPARHAAGDRIWFYGQDAAVDPVDYTVGVTVEAKVQTRTTRGLLDLELTATDSLVLSQRQARPYPPAGVTINGEQVPSAVIGMLSVAWFHRDRVLQADQLVDATMGSIGPEPGTSYIVRAYDSDDLLVHESVPIEGDVYETEFPHDGPLRVTVSSVRDALECWQVPSVSLTYTGTELPAEPGLVTEDMRAMTTESGRMFALDSLSDVETGPVKISELPAPTGELDGSELLAVVQGGVTVQITAGALREFVAAGIPAGRSAYQEALEGGFEGDEEAWLESLQGPAGGPTHVRFVAGTSYTLAATTDAGAWLECSAGEIRLPETAAAGFATNMFVEIRQQGPDPIQFVADSAAVVMEFDSMLFAPATRYVGGVVVLKVTGTNTYALVGALADA